MGYFWAAVAEKCQESKSVFCVSYICFKAMWHRGQPSEKELWIWPLNLLTGSEEAESVLKEFISCTDKELACRCVRLQAWENVRLGCQDVSLFSRQITSLNVRGHKCSKCQATREHVQTQCIRYTVNSVKTLIYSLQPPVRFLLFTSAFYDPPKLCVAAFLHPVSRKRESASLLDPISLHSLTEIKFN